MIKQGYRYHKLCKAFSKFYYEHSELIVKRIVGKLNFSYPFKKIIKRYERVGYNMDFMCHSACLVVNPITFYSYGFLLDC